jgi:hypothetical protein
MSMDFPELRKYVSRQLSELRNRDDLIFEICNKTGMDWPQAVEFIEGVEAEYGHKISRSRQILLLVMGWMIMIAGMGLVVLVLYLAYHDGWYSLINYSPYFYLLITGISMISGGAIGMIRSC